MAFEKETRGGRDRERGTSPVLPMKSLLGYSGTCLSRRGRRGSSVYFADPGKARSCCSRALFMRKNSIHRDVGGRKLLCDVLCTYMRAPGSFFLPHTQREEILTPAPPVPPPAGFTEAATLRLLFRSVRGLSRIIDRRAGCMVLLFPTPSNEFCLSPPGSHVPYHTVVCRSRFCCRSCVEVVWEQHTNTHNCTPKSLWRERISEGDLLRHARSESRAPHDSTVFQSGGDTDGCSSHRQRRSWVPTFCFVSGVSRAPVIICIHLEQP